jgi:hypothetical protein
MIAESYLRAREPERGLEVVAQALKEIEASGRPSVPSRSCPPRRSEELGRLRLAGIGSDAVADKPATLSSEVSFRQVCVNQKRSPWCYIEYIRYDEDLTARIQEIAHRYQSTLEMNRARHVETVSPFHRFVGHSRRILCGC